MSSLSDTYGQFSILCVCARVCVSVCALESPSEDHHCLFVDLDDFVSSMNPLGFICRRLKSRITVFDSH